MALPKIDLPLFDITIPSTGKKTKFRPFNVKEEKILLIAQESKDLDQIVLSIKQIITNCVQNVDADKLAMFDLEYLLINIRAKSVNNLITFKIKDPETSEQIELELDISEVSVKTDPTHSKIVKIDDNNSIVMRYPTLNEIRDLTKSKTQEAVFDVMASCIDVIASGDEVYHASEYTRDELIEFVDGLTNGVVNNMQAFFETIPVLRYEKKYTNKLGEEKTFVVEGMETFFI